MLEIDLLADLKALTGWGVHPIKIPQNAKFPAIVYNEIGNNRNSDSSLCGSELRTLRYDIVLVTPDSEQVILKKKDIIDRYDGFSGMLGATNIFIARVQSSVPTFDNAQQNFEYNITIEFVERQ